MATIALNNNNNNLSSPQSGANSMQLINLMGGNMTPQHQHKYQQNSSPNGNVPTPSTPNSLVSLPRNSVGSSNSNSSSASKDAENMSLGSKCKRKINFSHLGIPKGTHQPATVARRNARERNRVKQVNNGFAALKQHIPLSHRSKKMSKVETLRCAVEYIKNLKGMLDINGALISSSGASTPTPSESSESGHTHSHHLHNIFAEFASNYHQPPPLNQLSPTSTSSVDEPSSPSYASEASSYNNNNQNNANNNPNNPNGGNNAKNNLYDYENYEPVSPEDDEELLDCISWWQQS